MECHQYLLYLLIRRRLEFFPNFERSGLIRFIIHWEWNMLRFNKIPHTVSNNIVRRCQFYRFGTVVSTDFCNKRPKTLLHDEQKLLYCPDLVKYFWTSHHHWDCLLTTIMQQKFWILNCILQNWESFTSASKAVRNCFSPQLIWKAKCGEKILIWKVMDHNVYSWLADTYQVVCTD